MTVAEHRAAARIAWRHAKRAKGRTALVLFLVALPIAALAAGGFVITSAMPTAEDHAIERLGSADMGINYYSMDLTVEEVVKALPPGSRVAFSQALNFTRIVDGGPYGINVTETSVPPDQPPYRARYMTLKGRMPHAAGEVAMNPRLAKVLDLEIGDELVLDEFDLRLRVVGFAVEREEVRNLVILAGPGTLAAQIAATERKPPSERVGTDVFPLDWLIDLPAGVTASQAFPSLQSLEAEGEGRFGFYTRQSVIDTYRTEQLTLTGAAFGGTVGALFGTGLIAAAAFGVGARRQLRTLGLVGAAGGEARHARSIVLWGGTVVGAVGSAIGVLLAIAFAYVATPHIDWLVGRIVGPVQLPILTIVGAIVLGTVAATFAAFGPARQAAKVSTVDALAGRTPKPKPAGRQARRGLVVVVVGGVLVAIGAASRKEQILAAGFVITLAGFLFVIPLLVTAVGRLPARLPASLRLAARQTARYGRRTGAAVAAATLALTAPVAIAAYTLSDEAYIDQGIPLDRNQLLLGGSSDSSTGQLPVEVLDAARRAAPRGSVVAPIRYAADAPLSTTPGDKAPEPWYAFGPELEVETGVFSEDIGTLGIADATTLRAVGAADGIAALEAGKVVGVGVVIEDGVVDIGSGASAPDDRIEVPAVVVGPVRRLNEGEIPRYFISEAAAARYGLHVGISSNHGAVLRSPHELSDGEVRKIRHRLSAFEGAYAHSREDFMYGAGPARLLITAGATAVALIIVAVAVALVAAESRREHAVVVAVGAGPGIRRRTVAASAFLITALAAIIAVPAGVIPVAIVEVARTASQPIVIPWNIIGLVAVGAPLLAGVIAGAVSREPTSRALLQPVW